MSSFLQIVGVPFAPFFRTEQLLKSRKAKVYFHKEELDKKIWKQRDRNIVEFLIIGP